jgi:hypothetical protein
MFKWSIDGWGIHFGLRVYKEQYGNEYTSTVCQSRHDMSLYRWITTSSLITQFRGLKYGRNRRLVKGKDYEYS